MASGNQTCERELRGFSNRPAEDKQSRGSHEPGTQSEGRPVLTEFLERDCSGGRPDQKDAKHETEIADPVGQESLIGGVGRSSVIEPVTDQEVGTDSDQLPEDEHHDEVVRQHDPEHRKREQGKPAEIARTPLVVLHVPRE